MKLAIAVLIMAVNAAWGQQTVNGTPLLQTHIPNVYAAPGAELIQQKNGDVIAQPAPLKCDKYQHEVKHGWVEMNRCHSLGGNLVQCDKEPIDCVDDLHVVTEKEWQELQERIKYLDHLLNRVILFLPKPAR